MKHTEGPWKIDEWQYPSANPPRKELVVLGKTNRIASLDWDEGEANPYTIPEMEARANAQLIAAAPRMYDALRLFVDWHDTLLKGNTKKISVQRMHRFVSIAQDAINEIEGRE